MRILGGILKGRKVNIENKFKSKSSGIRPTSSKVREALFTIIGDNIRNRVFVDLYGGTGIIGFEAASRGAKKVIINEINKKYINYIKKNITDMNFINLIETSNLSAKKFLLNSFNEGIKYDIIFADPPYYLNEIDDLIIIIEKIDILNNEGYFIIEHFKKKILPDDIGILKKIRQYKYGDTILTFFRKVKNEENSYLSRNF